MFEFEARMSDAGFSLVVDLHMFRQYYSLESQNSRTSEYQSMIAWAGMKLYCACQYNDYATRYNIRLPI